MEKEVLIWIGAKRLYTKTFSFLINLNMSLPGECYTVLLHDHFHPFMGSTYLRNGGVIKER